MIRLVIGGARSGKSSFALRLGESLLRDSPHYFVATAKPVDEEMKERIRWHQLERSDGWLLVEEPIYLGRAIKNLDLRASKVVLVDCLGVWLTNLLCEPSEKDSLLLGFVESEIDALFQTIDEVKGGASELIFVSNEVGLGIVPEGWLSRLFRDMLGRLNQRLAAKADDVYFVISGLPLKIK